jgi:phosphatidylglycerol:prolipoprotein diacylglycerol transferase
MFITGQAMLAYYVHHLSPFIFQFRPGFGIRWYGFAYVMAFVCGYWLYKRLAERGYSELEPEKVGDFITWAALFGVMLGGRLGYALFYNFRETLRDPILIFKVWEGGMSSHGGILGLVLFTLYYARRHNLSWPGLGDNLVVVAPIGLFFGRCANFINGELYGRVTSVAWAMQFPKELYDSGELADKARIACHMDGVDAIIEQARGNGQVREALRGILSPRHPSQIYEAFFEGVVLFCALLFLRTRTRQPRGVITGAFFILYALLRIIGEFFREPDAWKIGWLTAGQFLSLFLILIGVAFVVYGKNNPQFEKAQS